MSMEVQDPQVLNYNGVVLNMSDLDCLKGPHYLTDSLIHFYFSYLTSMFDEDDDIFLVPPSISFLLANSWNSEAEIRAIVESNQLGRRKVVIFTVNNMEDTSREDQLHWSLLVDFRKSNAFVHYDSIDGFNSLAARKLYTAAKKLVAAATTQEPAPAAATQTPTRAATSSLVTNCCKQLQRFTKYPKKMLQFGAFVIISILSFYFHLFRDNYPSKVRYPMQKNINNNDEDDDDDDDDDPRFGEEKAMPQQTNTYDCGIYVIAVAKLVCEWYYDEKRAEQQHQQRQRHKRDNRFPSITNNLKNCQEKMLRSEMLQLVERHIRLSN